MIIICVGEYLKAHKALKFYGLQLNDNKPPRRIHINNH